MRQHQYCVYIAASPSRTVYTGVTSDLERRMWQHRPKIFKGFTADYGVTRLVWYEEYRMVDDAIAREKQLKRWRRQWKINLIETANPHWDDLAVGLGFERLEEAMEPPPAPNPSC